MTGTPQARGTIEDYLRDAQARGVVPVGFRVAGLEPLTGGRTGARSTLRGTLDGAAVAVEAVSLKDQRCVYDFLYVAPLEAFESGRPEFQAFVESLTVGAAR